MESWRQLLERIDLTEEELRQIPCVSNNLNLLLFTFYQNQGLFNINMDDVLKGLPYSLDEYIDTNKWTDSFSSVKIVYNSFYHSRKVLSHKICYKIGQNFLNTQNNLLKIFFTLLPIETIIKKANKQNEKFTNATILDIIYFKKGYALLKNTPYPYYKSIGPGVNCHMARGIISAFFELHEIKDYRLKELFCAYKIQNIINTVYARLKWRYHEDKEYIYLNGDKIAEKIKLDAINFQNQQVFIPKIVKGDTEYNAVRVMKDISYNEVEIFKENEIYDAPYCLFEFSWKSNALYKRVKTFIKKAVEVKKDFIQQMERQIEFSNQKLFEALENRKLAIESLEKASKLKDEFLASTAHELRTPLNGIIGLAEFLMEDGKGSLGPVQRENLSMIVSSGKRLSNLVNDILDYSRLKSKEIKLQLRSVDLRQITELTFKMHKPLLKGKPITLKNSIPEGIPLVKGDENRVSQIMDNLIGNAVKFTEEGSIEVSAKLKDEFVEVSVSDTGIGIPQDKIDTIFDSFEQVDELIADRYEGTGIGLYITKKLVHLHGGTIRVESTLGKGTQFYFTLLKTDEQKENNKSKIPVLLKVEENDAREKSPENENRGTNGAFEILAVDDDPINLQVLSNFLSRDYKVRTLTSGQEVLNLLNGHSHRPDLILLDIMMPGISGLDVCYEIRKRFSMDELPVIMISARDRIYDLARGLQMEANDYLPKPLSKAELLARVDLHLRLKQSLEKEKMHMQELFQADKLISLGTLAAEVAHEINNPNNNIIVNAKLLSRSYQYMKYILDCFYEENGDFQLGGYYYSEMKERFPDLFSGIINASEKIKRIVEYLRSFVRKGTENITESIEINKVVESAVSLVSNLIKKSTDNFKINYSTDLPLIEGNFQRLEQVMVNLLQNACQALKSKEEGINVSTCIDNQENVVVEIEDEGIGMDEETKNRIMEPFFTTKSEGIGLGLFISFKIIKTHKGDLTFISGLNKGTRSIISLPIKSEDIRSEIYYNERKFTV